MTPIYAIGHRRRKRGGGGGQGGDSPPPSFKLGGHHPPNFTHCLHNELYCSIVVVDVVPHLCSLMREGNHIFVVLKKCCPLSQSIFLRLCWCLWNVIISAKRCCSSDGNSSRHKTSQLQLILGYIVATCTILFSAHLERLGKQERARQV